MLIVTGDTHGDQILFMSYILPFLKPGDTCIILGDFGKFDGRYWSEPMVFDSIAEMDITILFVDGNHEPFEDFKKYEISEWHGGKVQFLRHNIIHLMRGEIYEIDGKTVFVMGGGVSVDKEFRTPGKNWFPEEMPSEQEYRNAIDNLKKVGNKVDYIFSHTAPGETVEYMSHLGKGIRSDVVDEYPLTGFFNGIVDSVSYEKWYFGHFHIDEELWRNQYAVYNGMRELHTGTLIKTRI